VKLESEGLDVAIEEPTAEAIEKCFIAMESWSSKGVIGDRSRKRDAVGALASMINQLNEFGPIESRIKQAREKLSKEDFARLEEKIVWVKTPLNWSKDQVKDWLRAVEPQDYLWWCQLIGQEPPWKLEQMLRPLRLSMFNGAAVDPLHPQWTEGQRKAAAARILEQLRKIHLAQDSAYELAA
jgi:hypothetical protein